MSDDERELHTAWLRHVGTDSDAQRWFAEVVARHREPGRHYHDLRHVRWVVHHARRLAAEAAAPPLTAPTVDAVVAAAFFHDAVYDVHRHDNELLSARLAGRALSEIGWPPETSAVVEVLIEATAHVADTAISPADGGAGRDVLVAADLAVLAADPARYTDYVRAVRREYGHLGDDQWRDGRAAFAEAMLSREHVFPPSLALDAWERRARANLTAELATLRP